MPQYIIFYGTLASNSSTRVHGAIQKSLTFVGECTAPGLLYNLGRYPGLKEGAGVIHGELYEIKDETILAILDEFEAGDDNNPDLPGFTRKRITAIEPNVEAWIYYYDGKPDESQRILSGKWQ